MAKLRGPLLSIGAQGQIGKAMVIASWRGVPYARQHVTPSNPRTVAQQSTRNAFSGLDSQYKRTLTLGQEIWEAAAQGRPLTARNAYLSSNMKAVRGEADMSDFVASPGVRSGLPGSNPVAAGGGASGEIDADLDIGQAPVDWENPFVYFFAFPDRDPADPMSDFVVEASETGAGDSYSPPVTISHTFDSLEPGTLYVVSMVPVWTRSDGRTAYGPSSTVTATATA